MNCHMQVKRWQLCGGPERESTEAGAGGDIKVVLRATPHPAEHLGMEVRVPVESEGKPWEDLVYVFKRHP